jgi:hypothetical protein
LPAHDLEAMQLETGFPCPRRESLNVDDHLTAELAVLGAHHETGHLFRALFDTACERWSKPERLTIIRRIARAYRDPKISSILWPPRPEKPDKLEGL